jgi:hypothetical protein
MALKKGSTNFDAELLVNYSKRRPGAPGTHQFRRKNRTGSKAMVKRAGGLLVAQG